MQASPKTDVSSDKQRILVVEDDETLALGLELNLEAEGYAVERVNQAKGDAERLKRVYEEYRKAPDVTRRRLYIEAMARVLPKVKDIVVLDDAARGVLPLLNLGQKAGGGK